jgi:hypothetical protein
MKRASAASDDLEAELDHRIGVRLAVLRSPVRYLPATRRTTSFDPADLCTIHGHHCRCE